MNEERNPGRAIADAIFDAFPNFRPVTADPGKQWDSVYVSREQCNHLAAAVLQGLDKAGFKIVPK